MSAVRPQARLPKGFRDAFPSDVRLRRQTIETICKVYTVFGFAPLETSSIEYLDALGKYLPDTDAPGGGVFALRDDDGEWIALRYDLTAPLARVFSEHRVDLPLPFRRYQFGPVWRREKKPGPGRFREFYQCDFDTVGTSSPAADAEVCAVLCRALEALEIRREDFVIRVNNRKLLNGVLDAVKIDDPAQRLVVLRSIDKLDKFGERGVIQLLGAGRTDPSGERTQGAGLDDRQIETIMRMLHCSVEDRLATCDAAAELVQGSPAGQEGIDELRQIHALLDAMELPASVVRFDTNVVRGLEYYTGPVFEAELTFTVEEDGETKKFGSVAGGGRYDYLVERFTGEKVPATGASIGVDRLLAALSRRRGVAEEDAGPVMVTVMDRAQLPEYQRITNELRAAGIVAELYLGASGFKQQMKYADKRRSPIVVIAGSNEFEKGEITLKDMRAGKELSGQITDNTVWRKEQPAQRAVPRDRLVSEVQEILQRSRRGGI
ncbi:MAG: histidine--tRNA ligase [Pirellulales bacterium]